MIVIFDLDGTLLNTIADLGTACNYALTQVGLPTIPAERYPSMVGNGINKLLERAIRAANVPSTCHLPTISRLKEDFVPFYNEHNCDQTKPYEGIPELLAEFNAQGAFLAVASNKYQEATEKIVNHFFPNTFDVILGEREGVPRKPDPTIVHDILASQAALTALRSNGETIQQPEEVFYVGDSLVDIETARNAGLPVIACSWGFVPKADLEAAKPDYLVDLPTEIIFLYKK